MTLILGAADARASAAADRIRQAGAIVRETRPASWPFSREVGAGLPGAGPLVVYAPSLHEAFPSGQTGDTRLVLTQSIYLLQRWFDWLDARGNATLIADADADALRASAPEAFAGRGPWSRVALTDVGAASPGSARGPCGPLHDAFTTTDPEQRLTLCRRVADAAPDDPVAQLALGSACMERRDLQAAQAALEKAAALAPDWEASHYELGKLFLRLDDMERASRAFAEAGRLMPTFSPAFSNLGATLGELDRPDDALAALQQALRNDPNGYTILNNIGVVSRELGRLSESEAAFRRVTALAPDFVFGHYNLGHTLFLQGRYQAALAAYTEGQRRDPEENPRQACRLAVVKLAAGDAEGSLRDFQRYTAHLSKDQKRAILAEAQEILWALLTDQPGLAGWRRVADAIKSELDRI